MFSSPGQAGAPAGAQQPLNAAWGQALSLCFSLLEITRRQFSTEGAFVFNVFTLAGFRESLDKGGLSDSRELERVPLAVNCL
jgi:hypothetical protein